MVYFLFHAIVDAVAVIIALLLTPGVTVGTTFGLVEWFIVGVVFGVLNAFIRPVVVMFTGHWVIRTFGLFLVVINAIILGIMAWIFHWQVQGALWLLWSGLIVGIVLALLDAVFGLNRPLIKDADENSRLWDVIIKFSGNRSNQLITNLRLQQVYDILYRYLLEIALDRVPIVGALRERMGKIFFPHDQSAIAGLNTPAQVRVMLQTLGPTFVKFGQIVSSRAEALPPDWQLELEKLQNNVAPFPGPVAVAIVEAELKAPLAELFADFEVEPFAAASTAQVHRATMKNGDKVVVKVQRPNIGPKVEADLKILEDLLRALQPRFQFMQDNDLLGMFEEFASNIREELDYRIEAFNARRLASNMSVFPEVRVPKTYSRYTTAKVETMDFVQGVKIIEVDKIAAAGWNPKQISAVFLNVMIKQIIFDGYFHGDAHPGNILVSLETGHIIFLDMGMMGRLDQDQRLNLADLIWTLNGTDSYELSESLLRLTTPFKDVYVSDFREDVDTIVERYLRFPDDSATLSGVLEAVFDTLARNGLRFGRELTMALKTLIQAEQIVHILDPELDISKESFADIQVFLTQQFTSENLQAMVHTQVMRTLKQLARRIPDLQQAALRWVDQYQKGELKLELDTGELNKRLDIFNDAAQRLAIGIILLGMVIGSAFATNISGFLLGMELSVLAFVVFIFAMGLGLVMVIRLIRELGKKPPEPPKLIY